MFSFHHVALSVLNLEESIAFYRVFGFKQVFAWQSEDGNLSIEHLRQGEMLLELFCFRNAVPAPTSSQSLATDLPRIGIKHFGLKVADISQAAEQLKRAGLAGDVEIVQGRTGIRYFFIKDPSGIMIEVVQDDRGV